LRGAGLDPALTDTDPQREGVAPLDPQPLEPEAKHTAELVTELVTQVQNVLAGEPKANGILLRGFDTHRELPGFAERYGLPPAAVAIYPMYRGIARLLGMDVLGRPTTLTDELQVLRDGWEDTTTSSSTTRGRIPPARTATAPARSPRSSSSTPSSPSCGRFCP